MSGKAILWHLLDTKSKFGHTQPLLPLVRVQLCHPVPSPVEVAFALQYPFRLTACARHSESQWPSIALRNRATGTTKGVGNDGYEQESA